MFTTFAAPMATPESVADTPSSMNTMGTATKDWAEESGAAGPNSASVPEGPVAHG